MVNLQSTRTNVRGNGILHLQVLKNLGYKLRIRQLIN